LLADSVILILPLDEAATVAALSYVRTNSWPALSPPPHPCCSFLQERLAQHPTTGPWWFRLAVAAEAYCIATFSELGRLAGHWQRHSSKGVVMAAWKVVQLMGQRFDWFCGMEPGVVIKEQRHAAAAFCVHAAVVMAVLAWQVQG
jgi:hypothetical protein